MIIMRDLDWQFGISNLAGDFNMNFFAWDRRICSKNLFFRKIEIRKIGDIFAINYSEKIPDHQSSSKNPVVSKNWRSNYRGTTVSIPLSKIEMSVFQIPISAFQLEISLFQSAFQLKIHVIPKIRYLYLLEMISVFEVQISALNG